MYVTVRRIEPTTAEAETYLGSPSFPDNVWEEETEHADFSPRPLAMHGGRLWFGLGLVVALVGFGLLGRLSTVDGAPAPRTAAGPVATPLVELPFSIVDPAEGATIHGATVEIRGVATESIGTVHLAVVVGGAVLGWGTTRLERPGPWAASIPIFAPPVAVEAQIVASPVEPGAKAPGTAREMLTAATVRRTIALRSGGLVGLWPATIERSGATTVISVSGTASVGIGDVVVRLTGSDGRILAQGDGGILIDDSRPGAAGGYALGLGSFLVRLTVRDPIREGPVRAEIDWSDSIGGEWGTSVLTIIPVTPRIGVR